MRDVSRLRLREGARRTPRESVRRSRPCAPRVVYRDGTITGRGARRLRGERVDRLAADQSAAGPRRRAHLAFERRPLPAAASRPRARHLRAVRPPPRRWTTSPRWPPTPAARFTVRIATSVRRRRRRRRRPRGEAGSPRRSAAAAARRAGTRASPRARRRRRPTPSRRERERDVADRRAAPYTPRRASSVARTRRLAVSPRRRFATRCKVRAVGSVIVLHRLRVHGRACRLLATARDARRREVVGELSASPLVGAWVSPASKPPRSTASAPRWHVRARVQRARARVARRCRAARYHAGLSARASRPPSARAAPASVAPPAPSCSAAPRRAASPGVASPLGGPPSRRAEAALSAPAPPMTPREAAGEREFASALDRVRRRRVGGQSSARRTPSRTVERLPLVRILLRFFGGALLPRRGADSAASGRHWLAQCRDHLVVLGAVLPPQETSSWLLAPGIEVAAELSESRWRCRGFTLCAIRSPDGAAPSRPLPSKRCPSYHRCARRAPSAAARASSSFTRRPLVAGDHQRAADILLNDTCGSATPTRGGSTRQPREADAARPPANPPSCGCDRRPRQRGVAVAPQPAACRRGTRCGSPRARTPSASGANEA